MAMMNEVKSQTLFRFSKSSGYCSDSDVSDGGDGDIAESRLTFRSKVEDLNDSSEAIRSFLDLAHDEPEGRRREALLCGTAVLGLDRVPKVIQRSSAKRWSLIHRLSSSDSNRNMLRVGLSFLSSQTTYNGTQGPLQ